MQDPKVMSVMIIEANPNMRSIMRGIVHDIDIKNIQEAPDIEAEGTKSSRKLLLT